MNTISLINMMPLGKEQVKSFVDLTVQSVLDGNINPLDLAIKLKFIQKSVEEIQKQIQDLATNEAEKYGKSFELNGAKVEIANVGVKYDYSGCCDFDWELNDSIEKDAKEKKKEREKFLKGIKGQLTIVNEATGEVMTLFEPKKTGKESIKITL